MPWPQVKKVVRSDCVNGQIVAAVQKRNASCFAALVRAELRSCDSCMLPHSVNNHAPSQGLPPTPPLACLLARLCFADLGASLHGDLAAAAAAAAEFIALLSLS
jgi:hypothetical protein